MDSKELLRIILINLNSKFKDCSENCSYIFSKLQDQDPVDYANAVGKLEAYGDILSYISEIYRQLNLGILEGGKHGNSTNNQYTK